MILILVSGFALDWFQVCPLLGFFVLVLLGIRLLPVVFSQFSSLYYCLSSALLRRCNTFILESLLLHRIDVTHFDSYVR